MCPHSLYLVTKPRLDYLFTVFSRFLLIPLFLGLSACGGGGGGSSSGGSVNYIGGSGLSVNSSSLNLILDRNGSRTSSGVTASWTSPAVTHIVAGMPPGVDQPSWLNLSFFGNTSPINLTIGLSSASLPIGIYETTIRVATINVQTPMDYRDIRVRIEVVERPDASPTSLTFNMVEGVLPSPQSVTLSRTGSTVTILGSTFIANNKGSDYTINGESVEVALNSTAQTLTPGVYNSSLEINYNGGRWSIPIRFNISNAISAPSQVTFDIDAGSLPGDKTTNISVGSNLASPINWTANFPASWLTLSTSSGDTITPNNLGLTLEQSALDMLRGGSYTENITLTSSDANVSDLIVPVTLNMNFNDVTYVAPFMAVASTSEEVIIRGTGFLSLANPIVSFGGTNAIAQTIVSDTEIRATHPALTSGSYPVQVTGDNGSTRSFAALEVFDPPSYSRYWNTSPSYPTLRNLFFHPHTGGLLTVFKGSTSGTVARFELVGSNWTSVSGADNFVWKNAGIAQTPDGEYFYGEAISDRVRADTATTTLETLYDNGAPGIAGGFKSAGFTNNGFLLLTNSFSNVSRIYKYDYLNDSNTLLYNSSSDGADRIARASLDGRRIYFVSSSGDRAVKYYDSSTDQLLTMSLSVQATHLVVDRDGDRIIIGNNLYDGSGTLLGSLPLSALSSVITPDGTTAYTVESDTTGVTIHKYDLTTSNGSGGFVEVGAGTFISGPEIMNPKITISFDGGTLFILSSRGFHVEPVP